MPPPVAAETSAAWQREVVPDDVLLFRYSAHTVNAHRIHYDRNSVTRVEGYSGLIAHGPLIATLLVDLLRRHAQVLSYSDLISKRCVRPLTCTRFALMRSPLTLAKQCASGHKIMKAG